MFVWREKSVIKRAMLVSITTDPYGDPNEHRHRTQVDFRTLPEDPGKKAFSGTAVLDSPDLEPIVFLRNAFEPQAPGTRPPLLDLTCKMEFDVVRKQAVYKLIGMLNTDTGEVWGKQ